MTLSLLGIIATSTLWNKTFEILRDSWTSLYRVPLDKMAALDPLALLEPEASPESWDSLDLRVLL